MQIRKRPLSIIMALCLMLFLVPVIFSRTVHAEPKVQEVKGLDFTGSGQSTNVRYQYDINDYTVFHDTPVSYGSTDENVAIVDPSDVSMYGASIIPRGVGDCTVWFCDAASRDMATTVAEAKIHVTKEGLLDYMKTYTGPEENYGIYGPKTLKLKGPAYASYSIKIGKHTYSGTFSKESKASIKLKTLYKLNTKITYNITSGGVTATWKDKIKSGTDIETVKLFGANKKVTIILENPHKGDVLSFKYAGKLYKKKIPKDYNGKKHGWTFKLKKKMKKNTKFTITIKNKYKQTLRKQKIALKNGRYWKYADEDEDD